MITTDSPVDEWTALYGGPDLDIAEMPSSSSSCSTCPCAVRGEITG